MVESSSTNQTPTADAGSDQTVALGSAVQLVGSASDPESGPLSYAWLQTSGPTAEISGEGLVRSFTPTEPGTYVFSLIVTDDGGLSSADTVVINVLENRTPSAQAGPNQVVQVGTQVTLDGTASSDPEGGALSYSWSQIDGPPATLVGTTGAQLTFSAPSSGGVLIFRLIVTDSAGITGVDEVQVTVVDEPVPTAETRVYLPLVQ